MLEIYLIRHGQTKWNLEKKMQGSLNSDLTVEGVEQAASLVKNLINTILIIFTQVRVLELWKLLE